MYETAFRGIIKSHYSFEVIRFETNVGSRMLSLRSINLL